MVGIHHLRRLRKLPLFSLLLLGLVWGSDTSAAPKKRRAGHLSGAKGTKKRRKARRRKKRPLRFREIRSLGKGRYAMSIKTKKFYLEPLSYVKLKVLVEPKERKGKAIGYSLLYVSTASPLRKMGFREKDVIVSVNGRRVHSTYSAFMAYMALKKKHEYVVRILRKRKPRTLHFFIR